MTRCAHRECRNPATPLRECCPRAPFLTFERMEVGVLAEILLHPGRALELAADLEVDDFSHPLRAAAFAAIRGLDAAGKPISIGTVTDAMHAEAVRRHGKRAVSDVDLFCDLAELLVVAPKYGDDDSTGASSTTPENDFEQLFPEHLRHLRTVANSRRALRSA